MKKLVVIFAPFFVLILVFQIFSQPVFAHEVYVLTPAQIAVDLQVHNINVFSSLGPIENKLWFLFFAVLAIVSLSISFVVSFSKWGIRVSKNINKLSQFALPLIRVVLGVALISSALHNSLFGPELSLSHLWMGEFVRIAFYICGILLILGLFIRIISIVLFSIFFLSIFNFNIYMLTYVNYLGEILVLFIMGADWLSLDRRLFGKSKFSLRKAEDFSISILRISFAIALLYAALYVKFLHPALAYQVVTQYHLTNFFPFDPLFVVLGAGFVEGVIATLFLIGVNMRWNILFFTFWVTLSLMYFGEAVWPHIILYGIACTLFLYGYDKLTLEKWIVGRTKKMFLRK